MIGTNGSAAEHSPGSGRDAPALSRLAELFGLDDFETAVVSAMWRATFDATYRSELLERDASSIAPTVRAIASHSGSGDRVRLSSESPLLVWGMVHEAPLADGSAALTLDPHVLAWLGGSRELDRVLVPCARRLSSDPAIEALLESLDVRFYAERLAGNLERGVSTIVSVPDEDRLAAFAAVSLVAKGIGLPVLRVGFSPLWASAEGERSTPTEPVRELVMRAHRQAFLDGAALLVESPGWLQRVPVMFPIQFVLGAIARPAAHPGVVHVALAWPPPTSGQKRALWLATQPAALAWPEDALARLSAPSDVTASDVVAVSTAAPPTPSAAEALLRARCREDLNGLAHVASAPFSWGDLVLPRETRRALEDIAFEATERSVLWEMPETSRLYPQGRGLVALFAGPPGTGKTMAAQVIANAVGRDLLRVDISAVVSKWVGETAQHLQRILSARVSRQSVLFFDEADAIYGKRIEETRTAQDRYANLDLSHLMVALEAFDGVVLLATNLKANIDGAFLRRIRHCVDFSSPGPAARAAIWRRVLVALFVSDREASSDDPLAAVHLEALAELECSGAQIKNAALSAAFACRRDRTAPTTELLSMLLARELTKDGAGFSARHLNELIRPAAEFHGVQGVGA